MRSQQHLQNCAGVHPVPRDGGEYGERAAQLVSHDGISRDNSCNHGHAINVKSNQMYL